MRLDRNAEPEVAALFARNKEHDMMMLEIYFVWQSIVLLSDRAIVHRVTEGKMLNRESSIPERAATSSIRVRISSVQKNEENDFDRLHGAKSA